jgi:geranylgeranyl diphosphate synthase, type II
MLPIERIEAALEQSMASLCAAPCPPKLSDALRYAVFPGGARVRPRLCLAVASACGDDRPALADAAAASIELIHCASLAHDDLPCFDNADVRRGKASVHKVYGEPIALLVGDALIVAAFETLGRSALSDCARAARLIGSLAKASGGPSGIVAGQAWECESEINLADYHSAKTGSLFAAATRAGAMAAGHDADAWSRLGELLGESYQVADDICDLVSSPEALGKPAHQDSRLGRPNAVAELGLDGAVARLKRLLAGAIESVPPCPGRDELKAHILNSARPYLPKELARVAA